MIGMLRVSPGLLTHMNWWKTRRRKQLDRIESMLQQLSQGQTEVNQQIADIISALNTNTNTIAANTDSIKAIADAEATEVAAMQTAIASLKTQLATAVANNQSPTQDQLDSLAAINARLTTTGAVLTQISTGMGSASDALKSLGADPTAPVPGVTVDPTTTTDPTPAPTAPATPTT